MSAPYWGRLPIPAGVVPQAGPTRHSGELVNPMEDLPSDDRPRSRRQRISVQTANTEATESTFSPFASPTASSFLGQGLAPRPPSYPYRNTPDYPPDIADKRAHRRTRTREDLNDLEYVSATPPAAPDVPRAPPISYRHPYSNGSTPDPYAAAAAAIANASKAARASVSPPAGFLDSRETQSPMPMVPIPRDQPPVDAGHQHTMTSHQPHIAGEVPLQQVRKGSVKEIIAGRSFPLDASAQPRRTSTASQSDRRRKFADDRSPLQRLELTLDSISKEEKRARVEAAEQRARQKALRVAETSKHQPVASPQQVRFREQATSNHELKERTPQPQIPQSRTIELGLIGHRSHLVQTPPINDRSLTLLGPEEPVLLPEELVHDATETVPVPLASGREITEIGSGTGNMGMPKRNLSFRERAAQKDMRLPNAMPSNAASTPPVASRPASNGTFSLTRSGSNKLKKDPPGDPWYRLRVEAQQTTTENHAQPMNHHTILDRESALVADDVYPPPDLRQPPHDQGTNFGSSPAANSVSKLNSQQAPFPTIRRNDTEPIPRATQTTVTFEDEHRVSRGHASDGDSGASGPDLRRPEYTPGAGLYLPPKFLEEWKQATVGALGGTLLSLTNDSAPPVDKDKAWWEGGEGRRGIPSRPRKAEAFDGEYTETNGPTRFKPQLYLSCGPLLRYCGIRRELAAKSARNPTIVEREIWRGTIMIVTMDSDSSYDITPTLRLFLQPIELLPPPPTHVNGDLSPEYVDPISGHPKLGRRGETLYVRPVEHLEEAKDLSHNTTEEGLYESTRSPPDIPLPTGVADLPGSYASRQKRIECDGEKVAKYKDVRGFRLHAERGHTFWRFNIEVELGDQQQRVAYRINRGPAMAFWVPMKGKAMNIMFHSCNGFGLNVDNSDDLSGPDPLWRDVLNTHQARPFHVMVGGGGQIFNDSVLHTCQRFREWYETRNALEKYSSPFSSEMQAELEEYYLAQYCKWFSQGLFSLAASQIPMVNILDDHEVIDGYGSYPRRAMDSPVFSGLGAVAFKYYMLFQHQSVVDETEASEPSWILGAAPGPYIKEYSRNVIVDLGSGISLLAVDCRTERTELDIIAEETWEKIMDRCYKDVKSGSTEHLLVVLPVPIAYPRMVWLENILSSRLMRPVKAVGKTGVLGTKLNQLDSGGDALDDLNDHWTAKAHKGERRDVIEQLQDLAAIKSVRVTILSGDVNLAAVGQFYSHPRFQLPKHKDFRYMPNIIASPVVNSPASDLIVDMLNKRNKVHHFDKYTEEDMIPLFSSGVDGKSRNNKRLLPHRNWCAIRVWEPGNTPPPSLAHSTRGTSISPPPSRGGIFRRLSSRLGSTRKPEVTTRDSRPPVSRSGSGGLFRSFSRRNSSDSARPAVVGGKLVRSLSVNRVDFNARRLVGLGNPDQFHQGTRHHDASMDDRASDNQPGGFLDSDPGPDAGPSWTSRLRGGGDPEYEQGDEAAFTARPMRSARPLSPEDVSGNFVPKPFHRTPTGLSTKQRKRADDFAVDLEGGLDISLNVEVNPKDPAGITVPYRILVPRLFHDEDDEKKHNALLASEQPSGFKRLLSFRGKRPTTSASDTQSAHHYSPPQISPPELRPIARGDERYGYDTVSSGDRYDSQGDVRMNAR